MLSTPQNTLKDLKARKFASVYFLHGDESFYIDEISDFIEANALNPAEKGFNQILLYGKDTTTGEILNQARRFPMMAEKQVVIVKEFQQLADLGKDESNKHWENYLAKPQASTILVLSHKYKTLAKNTKLYKALDKTAVIIESKKLYENQVGTWINEQVQAKGLKIEPKAVLLLVEAIGADLGRLHTELEKLALNTIAEKPIDEKMIEQYIGISKDFNVFELQKAIATKNHFKALQIIQYWESNPKKQPLIPTLAMLFGFFTKLLLAYQEKDKSDANLARVMGVAPFLMKDYKPALQNFNLTNVVDAISLLRKADLQTKGIEAGGETEADILKEFVFRVI